MKKNKIPWRKIYSVIIFIALVVIIVLLYVRITEISNQMAYLQDTNNVILSQVDNLQSNFKKTLEEENSLIESYSVEVIGMNFAAGTYEASVSVIPKEYTDETKVSMYFGTLECALTRNGYTYNGTVTLPLNNTYDGNLTVLLANGKKKSTEIFDDYEGLYTHLDQVLEGSLSKDPTYNDGKLSLNTECTYVLDGVESYEFESLELVFEMDGDEVGAIDLLTEAASDKDADEDDDTEAAAEISQVELPISGISGNSRVKFSYDLSDTLQDGEEAPENPRIRVYLRAISTEGYRFECTLSGGNDRVVYDSKGGSYELGDNIPEEIEIEE
jgi:hypothetical protein